MSLYVHSNVKLHQLLACIKFSNHKKAIGVTAIALYGNNALQTIFYFFSKEMRIYLHLKNLIPDTFSTIQPLLWKVKCGKISHILEKKPCDLRLLNNHFFDDGTTCIQIYICFNNFLTLSIPYVVVNAFVSFFHIPFLKSYIVITGGHVFVLQRWYSGGSRDWP